MMIITRCATPEHLASTSSNIAKAIWKYGGVVRDVKILSDRYAPYYLEFCPSSSKQTMAKMPY